MAAAKIKSVCVYAASSGAVDAQFAAAADLLGTLLGQRGYTLVYGAGNVGLMGVVARAVHAAGGRVVGVIPERLRDLELAYEDADELIVTQTMRERKALMEERADAFIALPGGFGTLEELIEVMVLKQLDYHQKPIVALNVDGAFDHLLSYFGHLCEKRFIKESHLDLIHVTDHAEHALTYIENHDGRAPEAKWFTERPDRRA